MRVLIVEDQPDLRRLMRDHLLAGGFTVDAVADLAGAEAALAAGSFDALVVDLGLPDGDGLALLKAGQGDRPPAIVVTARDAVSDRIAGLDAGADDYLVKPVNLDELVARLRAIMRRPGTRGSIVHRYGALSFDTVAREAAVGDVPVELGRREAGLLELLMRQAGQFIVRESLEERLYTFDDPVTPNAFEALVSRLRKRLRAAGADVHIDTRRGIGYRLALGADREAG